MTPEQDLPPARESDVSDLLAAGLGREPLRYDAEGLARVQARARQLLPPAWSPPLVPQVGGDHYAALVQHWDLCEVYDVAYLEATATK